MKDKFAYIKSCKCASTSIFRMFPDITLYKVQNRRDKAKFPNIHGIIDTWPRKKRKPGEKFPMLAQFARKELGDDYFLWSSVRNPYARVVSAYTNKIKGMTFYDFIGRLYDDELDWRIGWHCLPVSNYLCDSENNLLVNEVARVENLKNDINNMLIHLGKQPIEMENKNTTKHPHYREMYKNDNMIEKISEIYTKDIERWGYCF